MAAASYTTDLATLLLSESADSTSWAEPTATGWTNLGNTVTIPDTDDYIQGSACNSGQCKTGVGGLLGNYGSGVTLPTDGAFFIWVKYDASVSLATESSGGMRVIIGSSLSDFWAYTHFGSDTYQYGGWMCLPNADPSNLTASYTVGSPGSARQYVGWAYNAPTSVPSKGNPYKIDAVRWGRGEFRVNGGDLSNGYATFAGMAQTNDYNDGTNGYNRWGLFQEIDGGYRWQGLMTLGYSSAVDFRDSNRNIVIANTKKVTSAFNTIEIKQATSRVDWTTISFQSLGTVSKGTLTVTDNADVNIDSCNFSKMGDFTFLSNSSIIDSAFRQCGQISLSTSVFTGNVVSDSSVASNTSAVIWNVATDPDGYLDGCSFVAGSTTTNHTCKERFRNCRNKYSWRRFPVIQDGRGNSVHSGESGDGGGHRSDCYRDQDTRRGDLSSCI